jgi:hypothetical protein
MLSISLQRRRGAEKNLNLHNSCIQLSRISNFNIFAGKPIHPENEKDLHPPPDPYGPFPEPV